MAGLTSLPDAPTVAQIVIAAAGESPADMRIVGQGVSALGWRVDTDHGSYCLLVGLPDAGEGMAASPPQFEARSALLRELHARDLRCPEPVATDRTPGIPPSLTRWRWMLTTWLEGEPVGDQMTPEIARELGALVGALHAIPVEGHGLLEDTDVAVRGAAGDASAGVLSRWGEELWPFDGRPLIAHPLVQAAQHLVVPIGELRDQLLAYAPADGASPARAVCHTDLNGAHILALDRHLAGLLDFGDAAIVPPAFDLASFAYFFGWDAVEWLLEGYTTNRVLREIRRAEAYQLGIVLGLQKVHKHTPRSATGLPPDAERLRQAVEFLEATVPLAVRRADA